MECKQPCVRMPRDERTSSMTAPNGSAHKSKVAKRFHLTFDLASLCRRIAWANRHLRNVQSRSRRRGPGVTYRFQWTQEKCIFLGYPGPRMKVNFIRIRGISTWTFVAHNTVSPLARKFGENRRNPFISVCNGFRPRTVQRIFSMLMVKCCRKFGFQTRTAIHRRILLPRPPLIVHERKIYT